MASTNGPASSSGLVIVTASSSHSPRVWKACSTESASTSSTSLPMSVSKMIRTGTAVPAHADITIESATIQQANRRAAIREMLAGVLFSLKFDAPFPLPPSPRGRGRTAPRVKLDREAPDSPSNGLQDSLSPRERARVRGKGTLASRAMSALDLTSGHRAQGYVTLSHSFMLIGIGFGKTNA